MRDEAAPWPHNNRVQQSDAATDRGDVPGHRHQRQSGGYEQRAHDVASQRSPGEDRAHFTDSFKDWSVVPKLLIPVLPLRSN